MAMVAVALAMAPVVAMAMAMAMGMGMADWHRRQGTPSRHHPEMRIPCKLFFWRQMPVGCCTWPSLDQSGFWQPPCKRGC